MKTSLTASNKAAFTLIEVVLAIGIIAFAFVGVAALLPVGLDVSRRAIDTTIIAQIAQQLTTEAQQTNFSALPALAEASSSNPYRFDDQGNPAHAETDAVYKAVLEVSTRTALPAAVTSDRLATVTIYVLSTTSHRTDMRTEVAGNRDSKRFVILIPDNGA